MPSTQPIPTIDQFRRAAIDAVRAARLRRADNHDGAGYDYIFGASAILWSKQAQYVRDLFRSVYIDDADGPALTARIQSLWGIGRILDTYGTGTATFKRATTAAGAGTFLTGTRLRVGSTSYAVASDTTVSATATYAIVPIHATTYGPGVAASVSAAILDDTTWDPTWTCVGLQCADGTRFEQAEIFRARARQLRVQQRVGYANRTQSSIITACKAAGASYVAAFPSSFAGIGNDNGISAIYVGDGNFQGSTALVNAATVLLEGSRVLGADILIGQMAPTPLPIAGTVYLWDDPSRFDQVQLAGILQAAIVSFFGGSSGGFSYTLDELGGVLTGVSTAIQSVAFTTPSSSATIMQTVGGLLQFPATLPRFQVSAPAINFTFAPPQ